MSCDKRYVTRSFIFLGLIIPYADAGNVSRCSEHIADASRHVSSRVRGALHATDDVQDVILRRRRGSAVAS